MKYPTAFEPLPGKFHMMSASGEKEDRGPERVIDDKPVSSK